jgi:enoyl-CoA hydratase/carnithine racemase
MEITDRDGVRTVTFDRPDALNTLTTENAAELADVLSRADPAELDAVVLTGEGRAFSAGGDLESIAAFEETPAEAYERIDDTFGRLAEEALGCRVSVVARVNGDAIGAGMAVVGLSDFAYAADDARFSAAFVRIGLIPDTGGTVLLPRLVGLRAAKELAFTGRFFDAEEAAELGLINEAVPENDLDDRIEELLGVLRERPTRTIGMAKRAIHANMGRGVGEALDYESVVQSQALGTDEHREGLSAFLEEREPEFQS